MMLYVARRDIVHVPTVDEGGAVVCHDCGHAFPIDDGLFAIREGLLLIEIAGLSAYYPAHSETLGKDVVRCTHPAAKAQARELAVRMCESCGGSGEVRGDYECVHCEGSGMLGVVRDADGVERVVPIRSEVSYRALAAANPGEYSIKEASHLSEAEKAVNRQAWNAFLQLREATRPQETTSS